ncbi:RNA pol II accessory factor, Cdc73 family-domain-containing protein [Halteromyces radiatus]|uniref:RNA pol II accessory factor, Cdc73 family-domain-containing protein n=1 Tax=Halteromyces radiatus TaxID=101107 RepID=UPI00222031F2|nr:RNA pol II accessory factor, Cdc73 family-domain-containing protein [Halteromyces radiatus]KAI8093823.1 RNA pol II accessory factor, Cdc73 family-domain-containing protein [Halteromyces radiatus]
MNQSPNAVTLLREATINNNNNNIKLLDDNDQVVTAMSACTRIQFPSMDDSKPIFPRQTDTHIKKAAHDSNYTLDTLVFLIQHAQLDNSSYFKECREQHVDHVSIVDKRKILDYLTGKIDVLPTTEKRSREEGTTSTSSTVPEQKNDIKDNHIKKQKTIKLDDQAAVKRIMAHERELETRTSILQGTKSFDKLGDLVKSTLFATGKPSSNRSQHATMNGAGRGNDNKLNKQSKLSMEDKIPIIIVPAAPTAKLNLYNIKDFLQNEKFVDAQELRSSGEKKPEQVTVERKRANGQSVVYHVVDSVSHFKQSDWDRVCCVLASGQQWQFKGWKWEKPLEVFSNVKGFYPKWTSDKVTGTAADWAVQHLNIHRDRRYMDKAAVVDFWQKLDAFNQTQKPFLNY